MTETNGWRGKILLAAVVFAMMLHAPLPAPAADKAPGAQNPSSQPGVKPANSGVHPVTQAAVNAGILTCTSRINQVSSFLTAGSPGAGAYLYLPPADPDRHLISVSLEIQTSATASAYATASFAPNQANGCGGLYESVVYWPQGCADVAAKNFTGLKNAGVLAKNITVLDGGPFTRVFLMPAGKGCVAIKKEIVQ